MGPRHLGHGRDKEARGCRTADQARPALVILAALALAGCTDRWAELDPRPVVANMFGAHLEGREPPPGLDGAYPRLSSVPPRPEPPDPAARARVSSGLADDRAASRDALPPAGRPLGAPGAAPGAAPPAPPRLAAMPPIQLAPVPARPEPAALPVPAPAPAAPLPASPAPLPTPDAPAPAPAAFAPPPPPPRDLLAPPPPPPRELLAPRRD
jgi:hypothetical protein